MGVSKPKVSVIVCCYTMERLKDIHEAVRSILAQTLKPYEVIVAVDHNEELLLRLKAELPSDVKIVLNRGALGLSETRNVGIRTSSGEIVVFIDDDAVAEGDWLGNLTKHFHDPRVVAVGGRAIPLWPDRRRPSWFPEELDWIVGCTYKGLPVNGNEIRNVPGCNMAFRREVFERVGFWSSEIGSVGQRLKGGEEAELCLRIKRSMQDGLIFWEPVAVIHHRVSHSRMRLKWVLKNSFDQGLCKMKVKRFSFGSFNNVLSTEDSYLRYLVLKSIPERLGQFYHKGNLPQAGVIAISIVAVGMGYAVGKVKAR